MDTPTASPLRVPKVSLSKRNFDEAEETGPALAVLLAFTALASASAFAVEEPESLVPGAAAAVVAGTPLLDLQTRSLTPTALEAFALVELAGRALFP